MCVCSVHHANDLLDLVIVLSVRSKGNAGSPLNSRPKHMNGATLSCADPVLSGRRQHCSDRNWRDKLHAVMSERIGERHASACRYKKAMYRRAHTTPLAGLISGRVEYRCRHGGVRDPCACVDIPNARTGRSCWFPFSKGGKLTRERNGQKTLRAASLTCVRRIAMKRSRDGSCPAHESYGDGTMFGEFSDKNVQGTWHDVWQDLGQECPRYMNHIHRTKSSALRQGRTIAAICGSAIIDHP